MLRRARILLAAGESVILDASWRDPAQRAAAQELATSVYAALTQLRCEVPAPLATERLRERHGRHGEVSDADESIAEAIRSQLLPWAGSVGIDTSGVTSGSAAEALDAAAAAVLAGS
jgi:predicted kinase